MKKLLVIPFIFLALTAFTIFNNTWKSDPAHSQLMFTVSHLGISDVSGYFTDFSATVTASKPDFSDATFELKAKTASINTRVEQRDNHLKSGDFFDAEKHPELTFKSTSVKSDGKDKYKVTGNLTLRGTTKPVTLDLVYKGTIEHPMSKKPTAGFQVSGVIKRSDFNIGKDFPAPMISDEVRIKADGEFIKE